MDKLFEFSIGDLTFFRAPGPHLRKGDDWHSAYEAICDRIVSQVESRASLIEIPAYPLRFDADAKSMIFEFGAYWEGAVYFLHRHLGARRLFDGIVDTQYRGKAEGNASHHFRMERLFLEIWDSHGQLKFLLAFAVRQRFLCLGKIEYQDSWDFATLRDKWGDTIADWDPLADSDEIEDDWLLWLSTFVEQHIDEGNKYPNPYFGGTNALHLGLCAVPSGFVEEC